MSLPLRFFLFAAALLVAANGCVHPQSSPAMPGALLQTCLDEDYPALLLEKRALVGHHTIDDLDSVYHVSCRVLSSHKLEPQAGDSVILYVPSGPNRDESGPAERTRYWLVSGFGDKDWKPQRRPGKASGRSYTVNALDFHGIDAEQELLPVRTALRGVWKEMADIVAKQTQEGDFRIAHANRLEHIAPLETPPVGALVRVDEAPAVDCHLGNTLYIYLMDFGSGVNCWYGHVYRKNDKGCWELCRRVRFSSQGNIRAALKGDELIVSGARGIICRWPLTDSPQR